MARSATTPKPSRASPTCWSCWPQRPGERPEEVAGRYDQYGPLKRDLADALVELLRPVQERRAELSGDLAAVDRVLTRGAERAHEVAGATYVRAAEAIGLLNP